MNPGALVSKSGMLNTESYTPKQGRTLLSSSEVVFGGTTLGQRVDPKCVLQRQCPGFGTLPSHPSFFPLLPPAMNTAQGCSLKVACVSAAVSDESVAGDSGVYEASVQRWVPESWLSLGSLRMQSPGPLGCVGGAHRRPWPGDPTFPLGALFRVC